MQRSRSRMMQNVPKASVVITNPTHYAVALHYDHGQMAAPVVVAKGVDGIALKIREIAARARHPAGGEPPPRPRALRQCRDRSPDPGGALRRRGRSDQLCAEDREEAALNATLPAIPGATPELQPRARREHDGMGVSQLAIGEDRRLRRSAGA